MPERIDEGAIRFTFDDSWVIWKYDESTPYRQGIERLKDSKAVDFVGYVGDEPYLVEVKDFRGRRIENKERCGKPLAVEFALKVRDTLAGVIGAARNAADRADWRRLVRKLCDDSSKVRLRAVLWLEDDSARDPRKWKAMASAQAGLIKQQLSWLTRRVLIVNQMTHNLPGLSTRNVQNQGQS